MKAVVHMLIDAEVDASLQVSADGEHLLIETTGPTGWLPAFFVPIEEAHNLAASIIKAAEGAK